MSIAKRVLLGLCLAAGGGVLFAADPSSVATGAMTESATEGVIDTAAEKGSEMAKEQLLGKESQKEEEATSESEATKETEGGSEKKTESETDTKEGESGEESLMDKAKKLFE